MSAPVIHQLNFGPITAHAFNKDRTQVAVCPNTNEVQVYSKNGSGWTLLHTLVEHDKLITSIDWAPESNRLVSCSQDRNAYVWNYDASSMQWKPTLVVLRIHRAATVVRWSPNEDKFAVGSGARVIAICYFDEDFNFWTAKHLKNPIRSTVLSLDWHPNNVLLAAGSADFKTRVFSAFIKGLDKKPAPTVWGDRLPFNTVCGEFSTGFGGWVQSVAFSPSGDALAFSGHDSVVHVVYAGNNDQQEIRLNSLPYLSLTWISEDKIVAAGYDCTPVLLTFDGAKWSFSRAIDAGRRKAVGEASARNRFRQMDTRGIALDADANESADLSTVHQNTITLVLPFMGSRGGTTHVSTSGLDGKLVIWDVQNLSEQFDRMNI